MQRPTTQRYSLFTPSVSRPAIQQPEKIQGSKKRKRETFEIQTYKILPEITPIQENIDKKYAPPVATYEQEQIVVKADKALEVRSENLKDNIKSKSDKMLKFKSITQNVDSYVELDEKVIDLNSIKDYGYNNEYELCFDDFIKAKSIPLPPRVMEVYKACQAQSTTQVRCTTQIYPEANLVVLTVNQFLFLWQYYVNNNIDEYDASFELESKYNDKANFYEHQMKATIRAVGLGKPIARIFPNQDASFVLAVATSYNVRLFTLAFTQNEILMKYTDLETNLDDETLINKIIFTKTGRIFAGQTNEEVVMLNYEGGNRFQKLVPFLNGNPLKLQPSKKKSILNDISKKISTIFIQPFQKNYLYSIVDLAVDNTRHILYAYGIKIDNEYDFIIQVYDLGATGEDFKLLTVLKTIDVKKEIRRSCKFEERELQSLKISAMIPVEKNLSDSLNLLLVTNLGIRLYYQFKAFSGYESLSTQTTRPQTSGGIQNADNVNLVANYKILTEPNRPGERATVSIVKFPIVQTMESLQDQTSQYPLHARIKLSSANIISAQNKRISGAVNYKRNLFVILGDEEYKYSSHPQPNPTSNQIYAVTVNNAYQARAKNTYSSQRIIPECVSLCNIPNNVIINGLAPKEDRYLLTKPLSRLLGYELPEHILKQKFIGAAKAGTVSMDCLSDLARQVYYPPHMTLMLDDYELHYLVKFRPIDLLYQILLTSDENEFSQFFERYGRGETCAMLLQLVCNVGARYYLNTDTDRNYQGDPQKKAENAQYPERTQFKSYQQPEERSFRIIELSEELKQKAIDLFLRYGNSLSHSEFTDHTMKQGELSLGKFIEPQKRKYTSKLEGLFIYFSRVIRPIWSNHLMNYYVFGGYVPGQLPFYKQEDLFILKNRLEEMSQFLQYKGSSLLSQGNTQEQDQKQVRQQADLKTSLTHIITSTTKLAQLNKEGPNQARANQELQDILFEDQKTIDTFNEFLQKTIQALEIFMCLINDPQDLRKCIFELGETEGDKFVKLRFHDILRDGEYEALFRSLLYIKLLKINDNQFLDLAHQFRDRFWMFFSSTDIHVCRAERGLERAFLTRDENERNRLISLSIELLRENAEYIPKERLPKLFDLFMGLNLSPDFVKVLIEKIKTLAVLQAKLRNATTVTSDEIIKVTLAEISAEISLCREYILSLLQELQVAIDNIVPRGGLFGKMPIEHLQQLKRRIIHEIQNFDDEFLHTSLVKFLIRNRLLEDILLLDSRYVEGVLTSSAELEERDLILFDFFKKTGQYEKAFNAALSIATKDQAMVSNNQYVVPDEKVIPIDKRISYLKSAFQCLQKAIETTSDPDKQNLLIKQRSNLTTLIERTEIQERAILRYRALLQNSKGVLIENEKYNTYQIKIQELHRQIMDPAEFIDKYIEEDALYECKLMLLNCELQPSPEEVEVAYELLINEIYDDDTNVWPRSIRGKLLELHTMFAQREKVMFPLRKILSVVEDINSSHEPFANTLQYLVNNLMGQQKKAQPIKLPKEEMQYWATYFFTDTLGYPFREVFNTYREIYDEESNEEDSHFIQFHICNCLLVLMEWWLLKAQKSSRDISSLSIYGRKADQSAFIEIQSVRDEIQDVLTYLQEDLRKWRESRMFDPKLIEVACRLADIVRRNYEEVSKNIKDTSIYHSTLDSSFLTNTREQISRRDNL